MSINQNGIKQIASNILNAVKNQYPNNYKDTRQKEELVKNILGKLEKYNKQINQNNAPKITQIIVNDIVNENNKTINMASAQLERNNIHNRPIVIPQRTEKYNQPTNQSTDNIY